MIGRGSTSSVLALVCALLVIPVLFGVAGLWKDAPIQAGQPAPRTVIAPTLTRVADPAATDLARREAMDAVEVVLEGDPTARAAIVQSVRDAFAAVEAARQPGPEGQVASPDEQTRALAQRLSMASAPQLQLLIGLSDAQLAQVAAEAVDIAQQLARQRITAPDLAVSGTSSVVEGALRTELAVRSLPRGVDDAVVAIIRAELRPTVKVDEDATATARRAAAAEIAEVERSFIQGSPIVTAGQTVDQVQMAALRRHGLQGAHPLAELAGAAALALVLTVAMATFLRSYRPELWRRRQRLLLLALLALLLAVCIQLSALLGLAGSAQLFLIPVGAVVMLTTILFDAPVALLMLVPSITLVAYNAPAEPAVIAFAAISGLISVPLVSRLSARGHLRRAAWRSTLAYAVVAGVCAGVFDRTEAIAPAALAGLAGGLLTALIVNGLLPFLDSFFGILTATSLLDLADRNHPLLRELEQKALGSYNHSIMVATMVERACRAIGADSLLGSVAALYHDIGKVAQPYFFVENQFGVANPHDDLEPAVSAVIIQKHVEDGIEMATAHRLPPEVVEGIATHHGTTIVGYFHRKALMAADHPSQVDEAHFRYKGRRPSSREMAVLMLADCCESAGRAAAQADRNLSKPALEGIVTRLIRERVDDGQLDECSLTFADLRTAQQSFIETLVGVYHPRIVYPDPVEPAVHLDGLRLEVDGLEVDGLEVDGLEVDGLAVDGLAAAPTLAPPGSHRSGSGVAPVSLTPVSGRLPRTHHEAP